MPSASGGTRPAVIGLFLAVIVLVLDFLSKRWIEGVLAHGEVVAVTAFFNLVLAHNSGAAFSFLSNASGWQRPFFIVVAAIASAVILYLMRKHPTNRIFVIALGLILGGALGNLVDRVNLGFVVDFLDFHYAGYHWPAFNVADSAITCGAALLIWDSFRHSAPPEKY